MSAQVIADLGKVERHVGGTDVVEFDIFVEAVVVGHVKAAVVGDDVRWLVHDLVDDDRANGWIRIGQAGAHPELLHGARIVLAEAEMTHGRNVGVTGAGNIAAERNAVVGRAEFDTATVAGESPARISGEYGN